MCCWSVVPIFIQTKSPVLKYTPQNRPTTSPMRTTLTLASLIVLLLLACQASIHPASWFPYPPGSFLYQDDFSDPATGWKRAPDLPGGSLDYTGGVYRVRVSKPEHLLWSGPGIKFGDARIEVDAIPVSGEGDDDFGIVCRATNEDNFYFLVISSDGYYGIGKMKDGVPGLIGMAEMLPSEYIHQGQAINHLRADCIGDRLELYVNSQFHAGVEDPDFRRGRVGVFAGTLAAGSTDVVFDNFSVLAP